MELSELIRQAQSEMERGEYKIASDLFEHALTHFPQCLTAHRLLAECELERRNIEESIAHFQLALNVDPLNVLARLGMGAAAEEKRDLEAAYACYLHAWEINPGIDQVRDRLVMLRKALNVEPRLHLTRAGLASVHLRAGQYDRAITELRALVEAEPEARRARTTLAEALWRNGDDAAAATLARSSLDLAPENGHFLAILAEIDHRRAAPGADEAIERYQDVDPLGEIASLMAEWRGDRDLSPLFRDSAELPAPARAVPAKIDTGALSPALVAAVAGKFYEPVAPPVAVLVAQAAPPLPVEVPVLAGVRGVAGIDDAIQPFVWDDAPSARVVAPASGYSELWADWQNPTPAAPPPVETPPPPRKIVPPAPVLSTPKENPSAFMSADGKIDLTAGWDDLDRVLAEATPNGKTVGHFTDLLAELKVDGIAPFDVSEASPPDDAAWEPLFDVETPAPEMQAAPEPAVAAVVEPIQSVAEQALAPFAGDDIEFLPFLAADPDPVTAPRAVMASADVSVSVDDGLDGLQPFSFDDVAAVNESPVGGDGFDFGELDASTMAPPRPQRVSMLLNNSGPAVAAALAETFPDEPEAVQASAGPANAVARPAAPAARTAPAVDLNPSAGPEDATVSIFQVLRASKPRPAGRRAAPAPMFHVEHPAASAPPSIPFAYAAQASIDPGELMDLRIRLIEDEHSAGAVAMAIEAKLGGLRPDPSAARVLGEAYLRLGRVNQAAAQFRHAMLTRHQDRIPGSLQQ